mgnify:CR=1 FL=1
MTDTGHASAPASFTRRVAALAWPILVGQLAVIANGVIDTMMTARYSATDLAALGLGASSVLGLVSTFRAAAAEPGSACAALTSERPSNRPRPKTS